MVDTGSLCTPRRGLPVRPRRPRLPACTQPRPGRGSLGPARCNHSALGPGTAGSMARRMCPCSPQSLARPPRGAMSALPRSRRPHCSSKDRAWATVPGHRLLLCTNRDGRMPAAWGRVWWAGASNSRAPGTNTYQRINRQGQAGDRSSPAHAPSSAWTCCGDKFRRGRWPAFPRTQSRCCSGPSSGTRHVDEHAEETARCLAFSQTVGALLARSRMAAGARV